MLRLKSGGFYYGAFYFIHPRQVERRFSLLPDMDSSALTKIRSTACVIIQMEGMQTWLGAKLQVTLSLLKMAHSIISKRVIVGKGTIWHNKEWEGRGGYFFFYCKIFSINLWSEGSKVRYIIVLILSPRLWHYKEEVNWQISAAALQICQLIKKVGKFASVFFFICLLPHYILSLPFPVGPKDLSGQEKLMKSWCR